MDCLADGSSDICCFDECFVERTGIFANNSLNIEKLVNSITKGGNVGELETEIVKNSVKKCKQINKILARELVCKIPDAVFSLVQCVLKENYLNCPNVQENEDCKSLGKVLNPCVALKSITTTMKGKTGKTSTVKKTNNKAALAKNTLASESIKSTGKS